MSLSLFSILLIYFFQIHVLYFFNCCYSCVCVYILVEADENTRYPGAGDTDSSELWVPETELRSSERIVYTLNLCGCRELNSDLVEEQYTFLTSELSLQPHSLFLITTYYTIYLLLVLGHCTCIHSFIETVLMEKV